LENKLFYIIDAGCKHEVALYSSQILLKQEFCRQIFRNILKYNIWCNSLQ